MRQLSGRHEYLFPMNSCQYYRLPIKSVINRAYTMPSPNSPLKSAPDDHTMHTRQPEGVPINTAPSQRSRPSTESSRAKISAQVAWGHSQEHEYGNQFESKVKKNQMSKPRPRNEGSSADEYAEICHDENTEHTDQSPRQSKGSRRKRDDYPYLASETGRCNFRSSNKHLVYLIFTFCLTVFVLANAYIYHLNQVYRVSQDQAMRLKQKQLYAASQQQKASSNMQNNNQVKPGKVQEAERVPRVQKPEHVQKKQTLPQPATMNEAKTNIKKQEPKLPTINVIPQQVMNQNIPVAKNPRDLDDLTTTNLYKKAPQDIKDIFDKMIKLLPTPRTRRTYAYAQTEKAYWAYALHSNPDNPEFLRAEEYYYNTKYQVFKYTKELPLCIVAPGHNLVKKSRTAAFLASIQRQKYSNYRLVYVDDMSSDGTLAEFDRLIRASEGPLARTLSGNQIYSQSFIIDLDEQFDRNETLQRRTVLVQNSKRYYALGNRDRAIRKLCPLDSIVLDVDADDAFIGTLAFKMVNAIYHNVDTWMFNSVFIYDTQKPRKIIATGVRVGVDQNILRRNNYRTSFTWTTSQLRSFRTKLFVKIDQADFINSTTGQYYKWASDVFMMEPLVEMSGLKHYKHLYEILYFYDYDDVRSNIYIKKHYKNIALLQTPYQNLQSLEDTPKRVQDYVVPTRLRLDYNNVLMRARQEKIKYNQEFSY